MKSQSKGPVILSVLIITLGVGWLLTSQGFGPGINWVWTLGLGVCGILAFIVSGGLDKTSVVVAPFLMIGSMFSILRQTEAMSLNTEMPLLVITLGVLSLVAQSSRIPAPNWWIPTPAESAAQRTRQS